MRRTMFVLGMSALLGCGAGGAGNGRGRLRVEAIAEEAAEGSGTWLMLGADRLAFDGKAQTLARITGSGVVRWKRALPGMMVQVVEPGAELWFLGGGETWKPEIVRIDAENGMELGRVKAQHSLGSWLQRGGVLIHVDSYEVSRVDPATGNDVWSVKGGFVEYDAQVGAAAVWVRCDGGVCGFAAADGAVVATLPHANWPMLTPDGRRWCYRASVARGCTTRRPGR